MTDIASGRVIYLQKKIEDLTEAYEEYIRLLGEELDEVAPIAHVHGWQSTRFEQGEELRNKIKALKESV